MATERPKVKPRVVKNIWNSAKARDKDPKPKDAKPKDQRGFAKDRIQKDLTALQLSPTTTLDLPNPDDLFNMTLTIVVGHIHFTKDEVDRNYYEGAKLLFSVTMPDDFPHHPPKVRCLQKIYHPNLDLQGNVCLNILRKDWSPIWTLEYVFQALELLFTNLGKNDVTEPLNIEAGDDFERNNDNFRRNARTAMGGGIVHKQRYDKVLT